jgi:hypothetical protein
MLQRRVPKGAHAVLRGGVVPNLVSMILKFADPWYAWTGTIAGIGIGRDAGFGGQRCTIWRRQDQTPRITSPSQP